jgi:SAM-dependent methyltransferase
VLWLYLRERTPILRDDLAVLHWAPEPGLERNLRTLPNLRYTTADPDPDWGAMVQMDITDIPAGDDTYDVILCSHVLEHVEDDASALRELLRVLRPAGWAVLLVPIDKGRTETYEDPAIVAPADRERAYGQADHVRFYGTDFADRVAAAGFDVTVDRWAESLDPDLMRRFVLVPEELYVCRKPA